MEEGETHLEIGLDFELWLGNPSRRTLVWLFLSYGAQEMRRDNLTISAGLVKPPELQGKFHSVS